MNFRIVFLIIISFLFISSAHSQIADSLANYYYYINQAELLLAENNLNGADFKYNKAQEFKKNWFGRDLYNYSLLQIQLGNSKKAIPSLKKLIQKGFDLSLLNEKKSFREFFKTKPGKKILGKLEKFRPNFNQEIRNQFDSLSKIDRILTSKYNFKVYNDSIATVDSLIILKLENLFRLYNFPSEDLIGIYGWFTYQPTLDLIYHHSRRPQKGLVKDYLEFVNVAGQEGLLNNHSLSKFITKISSHDQYNSNGTIKKYVFKPSLNSESSSVELKDSIYTYFINGYRKDLDKERNKIGLPTMENEIKLAKFNWENETEYILGSGEKNTYQLKDQKSIDLTRKFEEEIEIQEY